MQLIEIILQLSLLLLLGYVAFFKSYFVEKGKNLATKEDIEEITKTIETVKNDIHLSTQFKISIKNEERNALVEGYIKYSNWLNSVVDVYFSGISEANEEALDSIYMKLDDAKFQYELAVAKIGLFVDQRELTELIGRLKISTLEFQHQVNDTSHKLKEIFFNMKVEMKATPIGNQPAVYKKYLDQQAEVFRVFRESKLAKFAEIAPLQRQYQLLSYNRIREITASRE